MKISNVTLYSTYYNIKIRDYKIKIQYFLRAAIINLLLGLNKYNNFALDYF